VGGGKGGYKADRKKVGNFLVPHRIREGDGQVRLGSLG